MKRHEHKPRTDWEIALWFAAEIHWLDRITPIELLQLDPDLAKDAAELAVLKRVGEVIGR